MGEVEIGWEEGGPNHTRLQWQREAAGSGMRSLTASPHWSHKFGKLHGNLISAAALCSPAEPRPGAGRHMCDGLPADPRQHVSNTDGGEVSLSAAAVREGAVTPGAVLLQPIYCRPCTSWGGIICGVGPGLFHFPSFSLFPSLQRPCSAAPARLQSSLS